MPELNIDVGFSFPDTDVIDSVLWVHPDNTLIEKSNHIVLLVHGKDNSGLGAWSWSYAAQLPKDNLIPATISLPKRNTTDLNYSGKFIAVAVWILKKRYPNYNVSILAHSMGNMATAWALHYRPTYMSKNVYSYVALGAPFQGIQSMDNTTAGQQAAIIQVTKGSDFIKKINSSPFPKPIRYLSVISSTDEIAMGGDAKKLASFPKGTIGEVQTPQDTFENSKKISHVGELADNSIYEMAVSFLKNKIPAPDAANIDYYPEMQRSGLELTVQYGSTDSHRGDAELLKEEPLSDDEII